MTRDKKVVVKTKTGGQYEFSYAPLDQILGVVRGPLATNGLALVQLLDADALVTMLIHESGAVLEAHTSLPSSGDLQGFGSAITYLRRYAIQALLGIAAEEDDDANRAAGNQATPKRGSGLVEDAAYAESIAHDEPIEHNGIGGLVGTAEVGKPPVDMQIRYSKDEGPVWGFALKDGATKFQCIAKGEFAERLANQEIATGTRVTIWHSSFEDIPWDKPLRGGGVKRITYRRFNLSRVKGPDFDLFALIPDAEEKPEPVEAESLPLPLSDEEETIDKALSA